MDACQQVQKQYDIAYEQISAKNAATFLAQ